MAELTCFQKNLTLIGNKFFPYEHRDGINRSKLARWLDKQPQTIINWLEGITTPTSRNVKEIVDALYETYRLKVTVKSLMSGDIAGLIENVDSTEQSLDVREFLVESMLKKLNKLPIERLKLAHEYVDILARDI